MAENTPLSIRAIMRAYPWRRIDPVPWTPLSKPVSECKVAFVSSAAQVLKGQKPFDSEIKGGDCVFPLGRPNDSVLQHHVLQQMLAMLEMPSEAPLLREWTAEHAAG